MPLAAGVRLGPYEIVAPLGAGGMGEVYQARDTRLGRTVAIKILPHEASSDPERLRRFAQEARAASALNHPHICVVHDVGESVLPSPAGPERADDAASRGEARAPSLVHYLVMEHLEGQTLAQRLRRGALPLAQALDLGAQIADALAAAHRQGIVHRDLKPGNIMLVKAGGGSQAKLLDFGLAKLSPRAGGSGAGESTLTQASPVTSAGTVLGTVPYMAPEQLEGKPSDARTDLFAFGCVLYEMLTGQRAFTGESDASLISAILTSEPPPIAARQPLAPPALERLVTGCLAKDPDARRESAHDLADELRTIGADTVAPVRKSAPAVRRRAWVVGAAALLVVVLAGAFTLGARNRWWNASPAPVQSDLALPDDVVFYPFDTIGMAFAPDGRGLVYHALDRNQERPRLYWQRLDGSPPVAIPGVESGGHPFFSPDGKRLGFVRQSKLVSMALPSGPPGDGQPIEPLADIAGMRGASWGDDGTILYAPQPYGGLWRVSSAGGGAREVTKPDPSKNEFSHRWPSFLPGGRGALFTVQHASGRQDRSAIAVLSLETGQWRRIIEGGSCGVYLPPGYVVFARNGSLLAVRFDLATLTVVGRPILVASGVYGRPYSGAGYANFAVSRSGALVFAAGEDLPDKGTFVWLDRQGRVEPLENTARPYRPGELTLSQDGQKLATSVMERDNSSLWIYHIADQRWQHLASDADDSDPVWSPAGDRLAFASNRDGAFNVYVTRPDEAGRVERLTRSPHWQFPVSWSRDGRFLAYQEQEEGIWSTWILPLGGESPEPRRWGTVNKNVASPAFSPDGKWLAYHSKEAGDKTEVHVRAISGQGPLLTVSGAGGGFGPVWSPDGREILYLPGVVTDNRAVPRYTAPVEFRLQRVVRVTSAAAHAAPDEAHRYWLTRPVAERLAAVEFLRRQHDGTGARLRRVLQLVDRPRR